MDPVFTMRVECDSPTMAGFGGYNHDREIEVSELDIVTGQEEICREPYFQRETVIAADGFIYDKEGRAAGLYLQTWYWEEKTERYELYPGRPLTIPVPVGYVKIEMIDDYETDTNYYSFTLRNAGGNGAE